MTLTDALVMFRYWTRSKTQGNWTDAHAQSYLTSAHRRAHLLEIKCDRSRFLTPYTITGTGSAEYSLPADFVRPANLKDSNNCKYMFISYDQKDAYSDYAAYIRDTYIGIISTPASGDTLTLAYYKKPQTWTLATASNLSDAAQEWAVLEAACCALTDRGDANLGALRDAQARLQREMIDAAREQVGVQPFNKTIQFDTIPVYRKIVS